MGAAVHMCPGYLLSTQVLGGGRDGRGCLCVPALALLCGGGASWLGSAPQQQHQLVSSSDLSLPPPHLLLSPKMGGERGRKG